MKKQLRVFHQPFRKTYRRRRSPRLIQMRTAKRRKAVQRFRRQKTDPVLEGAAKRSKTKKGTMEWSPEQLARIWKSTTG